MSKVILIAEDYDDVRGFMCLILRHRGFEVCEAADGSEALKIVNSRPPDLILMDISMPVMDGLEATRIIRASGAGIRLIPIIAVTAFGKAYREKALEAGCNEVISKPVDFEELNAVIAKCLAA